jgi:nonribosomal peptide synthetase DhbF
VLFIRAANGRPGQPDTAHLWRPYVTGTIDDHAVHCGHFEMMKPGPAAEIGALLTARLAG